MNGPRFVFVLYVSEDSPRYQEMERRFRMACDSYLADDYSLSTINIMSESRHEQCSAILATPTLVRLSPGPRRQYVGELTDSDSDQLLQQICSEAVS